MDILERRVSILEGDCMDKEAEILRLNQRLQHQEKAMEDLYQRVEGIDANRRLSSLILACEEFVSCPEEDIENKVTEVINTRLPKIQMTVNDIQAAHKLQGKNKVIVKFMKRRLRDAVYDSRFELVSGGTGQRQRRSGVAPLYLTESLTPGNRLLYTALLDAKREENGAKIASVFTRRGQVMCRTEKGGTNIRVPDWERLQLILDGAARGPQPAGRQAVAPSRRGGPPPSRPADPERASPPAPAGVHAGTRWLPSERRPVSGGAAPAAAGMVFPVVAPAAAPAAAPAVAPAAAPTVAPSAAPTVVPAVAPAAAPTVTPAAAPAAVLGADPAVSPSATTAAASAAASSPDGRMDVDRPVSEPSFPAPSERPSSGQPVRDVSAARGKDGRLT